MVARSFIGLDVDSKPITAFILDVSALLNSPDHTADQRLAFATAVEAFCNDKTQQAIITTSAVDVRWKRSIITLLPSPDFVALVKTFRKEGRHAKVPA